MRVLAGRIPKAIAVKKEKQKTFDLIDEITAALKEVEGQQSESTPVHDTAQDTVQSVLPNQSAGSRQHQPVTQVDPPDRPDRPDRPGASRSPSGASNLVENFASPPTTPPSPASVDPTVADRSIVPRLVTDFEQTDAGPSRPASPSPLLSIPGYKVVREIGRGGQAAVYEAIQLSTSRKVAVKVLRDGPISSPRETARFDREIHILAALDHPNIINVIDRGKTRNGGMFLVMTFIQGVTLDAWLADFRAQYAGNRKPEQVIKLLKLFLKILDAVNAARGKKLSVAEAEKAWALASDYRTPM